MAGCLFFVSQAVAQSQTDMRINEVLVINTDDYEDDFGHKHGWIELFNTSQGTVDIGGCYISNDPGNLTKYRIPKGDILTKIKPRQHVVLWADNMPFRGTFHVNFMLDTLGTNTLYFTSSNGRDLIDSVTVPSQFVTLKLQPHLYVLDYVEGRTGAFIDTVRTIPCFPVANVSYGRLKDGENEYGRNGWAFLAKTTPSSNNVIMDSEATAQRFKDFDPYGVVMAVTAMLVVFVALVLLFVIFKLVGKAAINSERKKAERAGASPTEAATAGETPGEVYAAIAAALHLYTQQEEAHDVETTILTINKVARTYSPWSSKIYGLRDTPQKSKNQ